MSAPEITPELLRAVADKACKLHLADGSETEITLRAWANHIEREQTDEKRIDELAQAYSDARFEARHWEYLTPERRESHRIGIRAVLAKLGEESDLITDPLEAADYQSRVLGITQEQCAAEERVEPYSIDGYLAAREAGKGGLAARLARQWDTLGNIPVDVMSVRSANGESLAREGLVWKRRHRDNREPLRPGPVKGPFVEIVGGDA